MVLKHALRLDEQSPLQLHEMSSLVQSGAGGTGEGIGIQFSFVVPGSDPHLQLYLPALSSGFGIIASI